MTGFSMHPEKIGETKENPVTLDFFREKAGEYGLYIGIGYVEYCEPKSYNCYAIISPEGEILADYRKIHPFTFGTEAVHYAGGEKLAFCRVREFTVSPLIRVLPLSGNSSGLQDKFRSRKDSRAKK